MKYFSGRIILLALSASLALTTVLTGCSREQKTKVESSVSVENSVSERVESDGDFGYRNKGGYAELIYYSGSMEAVEIKIPEKLNGLPVRSIADKVFNNCERTKKIIIPSNVEVIGKNAFDSCFKLESVTIPDSVTKLDEGCFKYCSSLKEVEMSANLREMGDYAFAGCETLSEITIPKSVSFIPEHAFSACYNLKSIGRDDIDITSQTVFKGYGVTGSFQECKNWTKDIPMRDDDNLKIYTALIKDVMPGTYEYKVRANGEWTDSWGEFENGYTYNSQVNKVVTVKRKSDVKIVMDARDNEEKPYWTVTATVTDDLS